MTELPATIDGVIEELGRIVDETVAENNFLGVFAYVYKRTTEEIRKEVEAGAFEDNERMERMDVIFAGLYIKAYRDYLRQGPVRGAWKISFDASREKLSIIQHLILGMNAHINLDLGVAAATVADKDDIQDLENDFMKVNDILADLTGEMQDRLSRVSRLMFLLDWVGKSRDEEVVNFSIAKARTQAWNFACNLAALKESDRLVKIREVDEVITALGGIIRRPPSRLLRYTLKVIRYFEEKEVRQIVAGLERDN